MIRGSLAGVRRDQLLCESMLRVADSGLSTFMSKTALDLILQAMHRFLQKTFSYGIISTLIGCKDVVDTPPEQTRAAASELLAVELGTTNYSPLSRASVFSVDGGRALKQNKYRSNINNYILYSRNMFKFIF